MFLCLFLLLFLLSGVNNYPNIVTHPLRSVWYNKCSTTFSSSFYCGAIYTTAWVYYGVGNLGSCVSGCSSASHYYCWPNAVPYDINCLQYQCGGIISPSKYNHQGCGAGLNGKRCHGGSCIQEQCNGFVDDWDYHSGCFGSGSCTNGVCYYYCSGTWGADFTSHPACSGSQYCRQSDETCKNYCYGFWEDNTLNVCSNHGDCIGEDNCDCDTDYYDLQCDNWDCYGISKNSASVCSYGFGTCTSPDTCTDFQCFGVQKDQPTVCNGHGTCDTPEICTCDLGYGGDNCSVCAPGYSGEECDQWDCFTVYKNDSNVCSGHGECVALNDCDCDPEYDCDSECSIPKCFGICGDEPNVCYPLDVAVIAPYVGTCVSPDVCSCYSRLYGDRCQYWDCYGIEAHNASVCSGNGESPFPFSSHSSFGCWLPADGCNCKRDPVNEFLYPGAIINYDYVGEQCEYWTCAPHTELGIPYNDPSVCNGNGECESLDNCVCPGYTGSFCDTSFVCNVGGLPKTNDDLIVCQGAGLCSATQDCDCYFDESASGHSETDADCARVAYGNAGECTSDDDCYTGRCYCTSPSTVHYTNPSCAGLGICVCEYWASKQDPLGPTYDTNHYGGLCASWDCGELEGNVWGDLTTPAGINKDHPKVCNSNGICHSNNLTEQTCECFNSYSGPGCLIEPCYGKEALLPGDACSGNGLCVGLDNCECFTNYFGDECELTTCGGFASDDPSVCTYGSGVCESYERCVCQFFRFGKYCERHGCQNPYTNVWVDSASQEVCSSYGTCNPSELCECDEGIGGPWCERYANCFGYESNDPEVCGGRGVCTEDDHCVCDPIEGTDLISVGLDCTNNPISIENITGNVWETQDIDSGSNGFFGGDPGLYTTIEGGGGSRRSVMEVETVGIRPGSRFGGSSWTNGSMFVFGGLGVDANGQFGVLGDFWEFEPDASIENEERPTKLGWNSHLYEDGQKYASYLGHTELSGDKTVGAPSARAFACTGVGNSNNNLYLFGGVFAENLSFEDLTEPEKTSTLRGDYGSVKLGDLVNLTRYNTGLKNDLWYEQKIEDPPNSEWILLSGDPAALNEPFKFTNDTNANISRYDFGNAPGGRGFSKCYVKDNKFYVVGGYGMGILSTQTNIPLLTPEIWDFSFDNLQWRFRGISFLPPFGASSVNTWNGNDGSSLYSYGGFALLGNPPSKRRIDLTEFLSINDLSILHSTPVSLFYTMDLNSMATYVLAPDGLLDDIADLTIDDLYAMVDTFTTAAINSNSSDYPPPLVQASSWFIGSGLSAVFYVFGGLTLGQGNKLKLTNARFKVFPEGMQLRGSRRRRNVLSFTPEGMEGKIKSLGEWRFSDVLYPAYVSPKNCDRKKEIAEERCEDFADDCDKHFVDTNYVNDVCMIGNTGRIRELPTLKHRAEECLRVLREQNITYLCNDIIAMGRPLYDSHAECRSQESRFLYQEECEADTVDMFQSFFSMKGMSNGGTLMERGIYLVEFGGFLFSNFFMPTNKMLFHQVLREPICFGVAAEFTKSVCGGHGKCIADDDCFCETLEYGGSKCDYPVCFGETVLTNNTCGTGSCIGPDECLCPLGFSGEQCDVPLCDPPCVFGICAAGNVCNCVPPGAWSGPLCDTPVCLSGCLNGGVCSGPDACTCVFPYYGDQCELLVNYTTYIDQITQLTDELAELELNYDILNETCVTDKNNLLVEITDLLQQLNNLQDAYDLLNQTSSDNNALLLAQIAELLVQLTDLQLAFDDLNETSIEIRYNLLAQIDSLLVQLGQLQADYFSLNETSTDIQQALLANITLLLTQLNELQIDYDNLNQTSIEEKNVLISQITSLLAQLAGLQTEFYNLNQTSIDTQNNLLAQITDLLAQLVNLQIDYDNLNQSSIATQNLLLSQISDLFSQLTQLQIDYYNLNLTSITIQTDLIDQIILLLSQLESLAYEYNLLNQTSTELQNQLYIQIMVLLGDIINLQADYDFLNQTSVEIQNLLLAQISSLINQLTQLELDFNLLNQTSVDIQNQLMGELYLLLTELTQLQLDFDILNQTSIDLQNSLLGQITILITQLSELETEFSNLNLSCIFIQNVLLSQITNLLDQLADLQLDFDNLNQTSIDLQNLLLSQLSSALYQLTQLHIDYNILNQTSIAIQEQLFGQITSLLIQLSQLEIEFYNLNLTSIDIQTTLLAQIIALLAQLADVQHEFDIFNQTSIEIQNNLIEQITSLIAQLTEIQIDYYILNITYVNTETELLECEAANQALVIELEQCNSTLANTTSLCGDRRCFGIRWDVEGVCGVWSHKYPYQRESHGICIDRNVCLCFNGWCGKKCTWRCIDS